MTSLSHNYADGHHVPEHFHEEDQLIYATRGVMTIETRSGAWLVPPHRAVWVPARMPHLIVMSGLVTMRTLYLRPRLVRQLPRRCVVLNVSPLLRELTLHACAKGGLRQSDPAERNLLRVIVDQLGAARWLPLELPLPRDPRALAIAQALLADPADPRPVESMCASAGASRRTIERFFIAETGLTFGRWRQQMRLLHGLRSIARGAKVTDAALDAGYDSPSAFIAVFRRVLGKTPTQYLIDDATKTPDS